MASLTDKPQRKLADSIMQAAYSRVASGQGEDGDSLLCVLDANHQESLILLVDIKDRVDHLSHHVNPGTGNGLQRIGILARINAPPVLGGAAMLAIVVSILERL